MECSMEKPQAQRQFGFEIVSNGASITTVAVGDFGELNVTDATLRTDAGSGIL